MEALYVRQWQTALWMNWLDKLLHYMLALHVKYSIPQNEAQEQNFKFHFQ
jgi:hypothetical protein